MTDHLMDKLSVAAAQLLKVPAAQLSLQRINDGLSHHSFVCDTGSSKYYIKVYTFRDKPAQRVAQINHITDLMCRKGIPAPQLLAYAPAYANVVVHTYVDADQIGWNSTLLAPLAELYSDITLIALAEKGSISKSAYLNALKSVETPILEQVDNKTGPSPGLNQQALKIYRQVIEGLTRHLPEKPLLVIKHHDDFTENNILADQSGIRLICDWDSWRDVVFVSHLASSASRFSTQAPMSGKLEKNRLAMFLGALSPEVILPVTKDTGFASIFPYLAVLKHIASYTFRNLKVNQGRAELQQTLLVDPLEHCQWMMDNHAMVSEWVDSILENLSQGRQPKSE